jgi:hypothetical protein
VEVGRRHGRRGSGVVLFERGVAGACGPTAAMAQAAGERWTTSERPREKTMKRATMR